MAGKKPVVSETPAPEPEVEPVEEQAPETYEQWLEKQPEDVKARLAEHTGGLKRALDSERVTRKELEKRAKRADELEAAEAKRAEAQLTAEQKLAKERDDALAEAKRAKEEAKNVRIRSAIEAKAAVLGFADPQDAHLYIDLGHVELDAQGNPQGIEDTLKDLAKNKPYLVAKPEKLNAKPALNPGGAGPVTETDADRRKRLGIG